MKYIEITLGKKGLETLLAEMNRLSNALESATIETEMRLAKFGASELRRELAFSEIDGNQPGVIEIEKLAPSGARVSHNGKQVAYLEFGTGHTGLTGRQYPDKEAFDRAGWELDAKKHGEKGWVYWNQVKGHFMRTK
jgi:hypothetical protein